MPDDDAAALLGAFRRRELGLGLGLGPKPAAFLDLGDARLLLVA